MNRVLLKLPVSFAKKLALVFSILVSFFIFLLPVAAQVSLSPSIYFKDASHAVAPGSEFMVTVFIDSPKPINAIDLTVKYPAKNLELLQADNSQSIIDVWTGSPQVSSDGIIKMQGGLSRAFSGQGGQIISLHFRATSAGIANLAFQYARAYYADGLGTKVEILGSPMNISITSTAPKVVLPIVNDTVAPPVFTVTVVQDPITHTMLAVFNAKDQESGIQAVFMRFKTWFSWSDWVLVSNPVPIAKSVWVFQIKAVDNYQNATAQTVYVPAHFTIKILYAAFLLVIILCIILLVRLVITHRKKIGV